MESVNNSPTYFADKGEGALFMHHIYIHNIPQGEGIYAGDTGFLTGWNRGSCGRLYPQKIEHVWIYNNFIEDIGWDAIQLNSCLEGGRIFKNFCVEYGTIGQAGQSNGIQIGLGNIGTVCERNFIRQSAERSDDFGNGILCQGGEITASETTSFTVPWKVQSTALNKQNTLQGGLVIYSSIAIF